MKTRFFVFLSLITVAVTGCLTFGGGEKKDATPTADSASSSSPKRKVGLILRHKENPFYKDMADGARKAGEDLDLEVLVKPFKLKEGVSAQVAAIDELVGAGVEAIVISPASSDDPRLMKTLQAARKNGIRVVNVDNPIDPVAKVNYQLTNVPFIGVENERAAFMATQCLTKRIKKKTDVAVLSGKGDLVVYAEREAGALRAFKENDDVNVVAVENLDGDAKSAYMAMARLSRLNPRIGAVSCGSDLIAYGVMKYLQRINVRNVLVTGFDDLSGMRRFLKNGELTATVNPNPNSQGYLGVKFANSLMKGETVPLKVDVDFSLVKSGK